MKILAYNAGHDGSAVLLRDGKLEFCLEGEKDSGSRHAMVSPNLFIRSLELAGIPDAIALSGWHRRANALMARTEGGYMGIGAEAMVQSAASVAGRSFPLFHCSHERSHILCSYGLSPFPQGQPCYVLVWEGKIGAFYRVDENVGIQKIGEAMHEPGGKYAFLYALADPTIPISPAWVRMEDAGKLMALAAYGERRAPTSDEQKLIDDILELQTVYGGGGHTAHKERLKDSAICNVGLRSQQFRDVARFFSDTLFERFLAFARENLTERLPLLISGGCGLNCDWNSRWKDCGLFPDVFVPPCTNDSGVALGAAIDAQRFHTRRAKIDWSVYCGEEFVDDLGDQVGLTPRALDLDDISERLQAGAVIAWVQGRYEMGPRALGNRSMLASPFGERMCDKLNHIKQREEFRPIAPICLQEDFREHFDGSSEESPHMLYFQRVKSPSLKAVTHVDGSARAQTVTARQNPQMHALLRKFKGRTGHGVLCNTSLNYKGAGFINRMSDLVQYSRERGLDGFVVGDRFFTL
jgi:predicted NodU family carbamoyl transferase